MPALLTPELVRAHALPAHSNQKHADLFDTECPNLYVRASHTGKKSYRVKYSLRGRQTSAKIGPAVASKPALKAARDRAFKIVAAAREGVDIVATEKVKASRRLVADAIPDYLATLKARIATDDLRQSSYDTVERYLQNGWRALHAKAVNEVARADVIAGLDRIERVSGPVAADRARSALAGFLDWCLDRGLILDVPFNRIKNRSPNGSRDRVLTLDELRLVWRAAEALEREAGTPHPYSRIIRLLALTGQRKGEMGGLSGPEVVENGEGLQIELPSSRTKNHRPHIVPLDPAAAALLPAVTAEKPCHFGRYGTAPFSGWSKGKRELDAKVAELNGGKPIDFTVHDLRRTFATHMAEQRFADDDLIECIVNHVSGRRSGVAGTYNRSKRLGERREALAKWARFVKRLVEPALAEAA